MSWNCLKSKKCFPENLFNYQLHHKKIMVFESSQFLNLQFFWIFFFNMVLGNGNGKVLKMFRITEKQCLWKNNFFFNFTENSYYPPQKWPKNMKIKSKLFFLESSEIQVIWACFDHEKIVFRNMSNNFFLDG